jgi:hypothetical protein
MKPAPSPRRIPVAALAADPAALFAAAVGGPPDPWQLAFLRSVAPRELVVASRQSGKSTATAVLAYHVAAFEPGALVLIVSTGIRSGSETFRKVLDAHRVAGGHVATENESSLRLELVNRSRVVVLPADPETVRGFSAPRLVIVDEAARVPDEMLVALRPMLATSRRGRLIAVTSAAWRSGWFWDAWDSKDSAWRRTLVTAADCPRISPAFLAEERAALGEAIFRQEYEGVFRVGGSLFDAEILDRMFRPGVFVEPISDGGEWTAAEAAPIGARKVSASAALAPVDESVLPFYGTEGGIVTARIRR